MNQNLVNPYQWLSDQISEVKDLVKTIQKNQVPTIGTPEAPDRYVNRVEAREICGKVSDPTMWSWENKGIIKGYRLGNKVFYKYSELMESGKFINRTSK